MDGFEGTSLPSPAPSPIPTPNPSEAAVIASPSEVRVGVDATYVLNDYGGVWAVGRGSYGQLGDNTHTASAVTPVQRVDDYVKNVVLLQQSKQYAEAYGTCVVAVTSGGTVYYWPEYTMAGSGVGGYVYTVSELTGFSSSVIDVAVGGYNQYHFICASLDSGEVECVGYNNYGQLGDGAKASQTTPVAVTGLPANFVAKYTACGVGHSCASNGTDVWCWGYNNYGQVGDGTTTVRTTATYVGGWGGSGANVSDLQCGDSHCCTLMTSGNMTCWGYNGQGQLGDGSTTNRYEPTHVSRLNNIAQISLSYRSSCALTVDGELYCWVRAFGVFRDRPQ